MADLEATAAPTPPPRQCAPPSPAPAASQNSALADTRTPDGMLTSICGHSTGGLPPVASLKEKKAVQRAQQPRSWKESVARYEGAKKELQFEPPLVIRHTKKAALATRKDNAQRWNPVLQVPQEPKARAAAASRAEDKLLSSINRGMQKELDVSQTGYNIINFSPKYSLTEQQVDEATVVGVRRGRKQMKPISETNYDILNLMQVPGRHDPKSDKKDRVHKRPAVFGHYLNREWNVTSGDFYVNNEERQREKEDQVRQMVEARFVATHDLHPVLGTYYDLDKEEAIQEQENEARFQKNCQHHSDVGPTTILRSEGHAFDILNGQEHHPTRAKLLDDAKVRGVMQRTQFRNRIARFGEDLLEEEKRQQARSQTRKNHQLRVNEHVQKGYDMITNQSYGLTRDQYNNANPDDKLADSIKGLKAPSVPLTNLRKTTVGDRLAQTHAQPHPPEGTNQAKVRGPPATTFERMFNLPKAIPQPPPSSSSSLMPKSSTGVVSGPASFIGSQRGSAAGSNPASLQASPRSLPSRSNMSTRSGVASRGSNLNTTMNSTFNNTNGVVIPPLRPLSNYSTFSEQN
eukprot:TRINITY_DN52848_c0_g1_i1.p1 TRINITY_DN52848_c0_g1~~TRINITY_DN52848_c0_g1_i1.p1  ORF type:complete len:574 (-),score=75.90 TRINITY_DN52848_c0_g1_i1:814-2535(-)